MTHENAKVKHAERRKDDYRYEEHVQKLCAIPGYLEGGAYFDCRKNRVVRFWRGHRYTDLKKISSNKIRNIGREEIIKYLKDEDHDVSVSRHTKHAFDVWWNYV